MRYNRLGRTGLFVSELCLGAMTFGGEGELWAALGALGQSESDALVKTAFDAGINFIDTADFYGAGRSEEITGQALRNLGIGRSEIVIATKGFGTMWPGPNGGGASRYHLIDACKASLKRLQIDHIDLYQIHGFDPATPIDETLDALDTLVRHGHVRYVGVSNWQAWQIMKALGISERRDLARFASVQAYYTVAGRDLERELVPMMLSEEVGLMVWSPLAGGLLSGKFQGGQGEGRRATSDFPPVEPARGAAVIAAMRPMADARGVSVAQIAIAWLLHQPVVSSVIVGAKRPEQLVDNIAATTVVLSADELATLDTASALPVEYPSWIMAWLGASRSKLLAGDRRGGRV